MKHGSAGDGAASEPGARLTPRERQVATLLALGQTNQQVASSLGISVRTVEVHRARAMEKLQARTRADVVTWALDNDLLH